jgi:hypothetical protein
VRLTLPPSPERDERRAQRRHPPRDEAFSGGIIHFGRCLAPLDRDMLVRMLFLSVLRQETARAVLATVARAIAVDVAPVRRRRSAQQHLRNGVGAIMHASSSAAWRATPVLSVWYATRRSVFDELRYGLEELTKARASVHMNRKQRALAMGIPAVVATSAIALRVKHRGQPAEETVAVAEHAPVLSLD